MKPASNFGRSFLRLAHSGNLRRLDPDPLGSADAWRRHPLSCCCRRRAPSASGSPALCRFWPTTYVGRSSRQCSPATSSAVARALQWPFLPIASPFAPRPAADRQHGVGPAHHRRRTNHGDVVRLRLAVEGGRHHHRPFFPMLVNTVAGLARLRPDGTRPDADLRFERLADATEARLPAAMPFIFNALKINSTLALIGAIVAEFFGTPIVGTGFHLHQIGHECRHGLGRDRRCGAGRLGSSMASSPRQKGR